MRNCCYVAVCSAARAASAPTGGGEGLGHIVAAARLQLVLYCRGNGTEKYESIHVVDRFFSATGL